MPIFYLYSKENPNPIIHYLTLWGNKHSSFLFPITYESFIKKKNLLPGIYLFTDIELIAGQQKKDISKQYRRLKEDSGQYITINNPEKTVARYPLLRILYNKNINSFNVFKFSESLQSIRYPVFLRRSNDHRGPQTGLITTKDALMKKMEELKLSDQNLHEWIITEFCDVSNSDGIYSKYSAFILNNKIIPRHIFFGTDWVQKFDMKLSGNEYREKEMAFLKSNPHEEQLRTVCQLAHIEFGRLDYGIVDGRVQVWEINTNPMIIAHSHVVANKRLSIHQLFFDLFSAELETLNATNATPFSPWHYWGDRMHSRWLCLLESQRHTFIGNCAKKIEWKIKSLTSR